jgi:hypothetical protein
LSLQSPVTRPTRDGASRPPNGFKRFTRVQRLAMRSLGGLSRQVASIRLYSPAHGVFFVDDNAGNVRAAQSLGIAGHCYRGVAELSAELSRVRVFPDI